MSLFPVSCRYSIHLWDMNQEGSWDNKSSYIYYTDLLMELLLLGLDLLHHIHMLVSSGDILTTFPALMSFIHTLR